MSPVDIFSFEMRSEQLVEPMLWRKPDAIRTSRSPDTGRRRTNIGIAGRLAADRPVAGHRCVDVPAEPGHLRSCGRRCPVRLDVVENLLKFRTNRTTRFGDIRRRPTDLGVAGRFGRSTKSFASTPSPNGGTQDHAVNVVAYVSTSSRIIRSLVRIVRRVSEISADDRCEWGVAGRLYIFPICFHVK